MIYTIIDTQTGQELYAKFDDIVLDGQLAITELRMDGMDNPYFDFKTRQFYDKMD